uniref:AP-4 complex subunit epsilon n=1 Tax=Denticeps clupeoides TaxID=299321 RepID=A0AAY4EMB5_9TELE
MSDVVEKTLTALPSLLSLDSQSGAGKLSSTSKLGGLIRSITELTSKHVCNLCTTISVNGDDVTRFGFSVYFFNGIRRRRSSLIANWQRSKNKSHLLTRLWEIIRRKAVLALHKFYLIAPNQVQHIHSKFRKALCDKDPGVMTASLHIYLQLIKENPDSYKDLTGSFVAILRQVVGGKLPVDFNYHNVPAPWLQIQLLRILSLLGKDDQSTSELMYEVLDESLRRAEMNHNITYAILYECVKAIYTIYPKSELLEKAAKCIGNFVVSPKINLKYLGLKALTYVVQQDASLALQHQMTIIECLDHSDSIIKRETLEVLFRITNVKNVAVIVEKMLDFLKLCNDDYTIIDLVGKVAELAEKYSPNNEWFIQTMNVVFSLGGELMHPDIPNNFLRLLAQGFGSEEEEQQQLRVFAVDSYLTLLESDTAHLPQRFLQVISWALGEFSYLKDGLEPCKVTKLLAKLLDERNVTSESRSWILSAMAKLSAGPGAAALALQVSERYSSSLDTVLRQQALELLHLSQDPELHARVLPHGAAWDSFEVDSSLSFLDSFVSEALSQGAAPYKAPHQRQEELRQEKALSLEPYSISLPVSLSSCSITDRQSPTLLSMSSSLSGNSNELKAGSSTLKLEGVKRVWGKEGYLHQQDAVEEAAQVEEAATPALPLSPQQGGAESQQTHGDLTVVEQEKQKLASSLFVGLGSQNSTFLMGKSDSTSQQFRRKTRAADSTSSGVSERSSSSSHSSCSDFLHNNLLEDSQNSLNTQKIGVSNGTHEGPVTQSFQTANGIPEEDGEELGNPLPVIVDSDVASIGTETSKETSPFLDAGMVLVQPCSPQTELRDFVQPGSSGITQTSLRSQFPPELSQLPHSDISLLSSDHSLSLSACRAYRDDALLFVIILSNCSQSSTNGLSVQLDCKQLKVASLRGNALENLPAHSMSVCWYALLMEEPHTQVTVAGSVSYRAVPGHTQTLQFTDKLFLTDFIRPLTLSTEEYGKLWLSFSQDVRQNLKLIQGEGDPLRATLSALKEQLQLHIVDIIGSEGIVACRLLPDSPCLLHCRIHGGSLAVWLRSPLLSLPDCLLYYCQKTLEEC